MKLRLYDSFNIGWMKTMVVNSMVVIFRINSINLFVRSTAIICKRVILFSFGITFEIKILIIIIFI